MKKGEAVAVALASVLLSTCIPMKSKSLPLWMAFAFVMTLVLALCSALPKVAAAASTYQPPAIRGHVTDMASKLQPAEIEGLNKKLADYRKCSTNHVAVFIAASLEGNTIEDVAYVTFNTWKIGAAEKDNGVLLVIAPSERKNFIATGKGVGGDLPDVQAFHILRDKVSPRLKEDKFFAAVEDGTTAIGQALGGDCAMQPSSVSGATTRESPATAPPEPRPSEPHTLARYGMIGGVVFLVLMIAWGRHAAPFVYLVIGFMTTIFGWIITGFYSSFDTFDVRGATDAFTVIGVILLILNVIVWLMRWRAPKRTGPFAPDSYENRAAAAGSLPSTSSSGGSSFDMSSSSSFGSSSSSSSSDSSSYSGGGGSTGGGGAGDSY